MIDVRLLRTDLEGVKRAIARRGIDTAPLDTAAELDARVRALAGERDALRAQVKSLSREVGEARRSGDGPRAEELMAKSRAIGARESDLEVETDGVATALRELLLVIPNLPAADCPDGESADDNVVVRVESYDPGGFADHQRVPHWEVGAQLGILDLERGAKLSGSMFPVYRGLGATMARGLCQLALDLNADAFEEIRPPSLVRSHTMVSTGHLPKFVDDAYHVERDDLWAIPTAEVPLTSLARDELLDEGDLPVRLMAYTPCYRREAGSAGRDTRGLLRVHEFDKVEILALTTPDQAQEMHADLVRRAEESLRRLGLAYRVVDICTADLGQSHARYFDLEVYAPGCDMWLEASSISWFTDYQARRANIRYRPSSGGTAFVHTLNGSALAVPRVWAAAVETHRQPDGSVVIPEALRPYCRGAERIT